MHPFLPSELNFKKLQIANLRFPLIGLHGKSTTNESVDGSHCEIALILLVLWQFILGRLLCNFSSYGIANVCGKKSRLHDSRMKFSLFSFICYSATRSHFIWKKGSTLLLEFCIAHRTLLVITVAGSQGQLCASIIVLNTI